MKTDAEAIMEVADALNRVAKAIERLGNGNAATEMGALETFGLHIGEKIDDAVSRIVESIDLVAKVTES